jgi:hypothetical protein
MTKLRCGATINECKPGTTPVRAPPCISENVTMLNIMTGPGASNTASYTQALKKCQDHAAN